MEINLQRVKTRQEQQFFNNVRIDPKNLKKFTHAFEQLNYRSALSNFSNERCKFNKNRCEIGYVLEVPKFCGIFAYYTLQIIFHTACLPTPYRLPLLARIVPMDLLRISPGLCRKKSFRSAAASGRLSTGHSPRRRLLVFASLPLDYHASCLHPSCMRLPRGLHFHKTRRTAIIMIVIITDQ